MAPPCSTPSSATPPIACAMHRPRPSRAFLLPGRLKALGRISRSWSSGVRAFGVRLRGFASCRFAEAEAKLPVAGRVREGHQVYSESKAISPPPRQASACLHQSGSSQSLAAALQTPCAIRYDAAYWITLVGCNYLLLR